MAAPGAGALSPVAPRCLGPQLNPPTRGTRIGQLTPQKLVSRPVEFHPSSCNANYGDFSDDEREKTCREPVFLADGEYSNRSKVRIEFAVTNSKQRIATGDYALDTV